MYTTRADNLTGSSIPGVQGLIGRTAGSVYRGHARTIRESHTAQGGTACSGDYQLDDVGGGGGGTWTLNR